MTATSGVSRLSVAMMVASVMLFTGFRSNASAESPSAPIDRNKYTFLCRVDPETKLPTTFAVSSDDKGKYGIPIIRWRSNYFKGWSPAQRCVAVSPRFQRASNLGLLSQLTNGTRNGEPVILAEADGESVLLFTLERLEDADAIKKDFERVITRQVAGGDFYRTVRPSEGGSFSFDLDQLLRYGKKVPLGDPL